MSICIKEEPTIDFTLELVPVPEEEPVPVNFSPNPEPVPLCALCIRECPANAESYEFNSENSSDFRGSLRELLGLEFQLQCFNVCKTCWKMVWMIGEFRECCRRAQALMERADSIELSIVDDWSSEEMGQTIDYLQEVIMGHTKLIEQAEPAEDELVTTVSYDQIKVQAYEAEEVGSKETLLAQDSEVERNTTIADCLVERSDEKCDSNRAKANKFACKYCDVSFSRRGHLNIHRQTLKHRRKLKSLGIVPNDAAYNNIVSGCTQKQLRGANGRYVSLSGHYSREFIAGLLSRGKPNVRPYVASQDAHTNNKFPSRSGTDTTDSQSDTDTDNKTANKKTFNCEKCNITFTRRFSLEKHKLTRKHEQTAGFFTCEKCNITFTRRFSLAKHKLTRKHQQIVGFRPLPRINPALLRKHKCPLCEAKMASKSSLLVHIRVKHGEAKFQCELCNGMFKTKYSLKRHLLRHHGLDATCVAGFMDKLAEIN